MTDEEDERNLLAEFRAKAEPLGIRVGQVGTVVQAAETLRDWSRGFAESVVVSSEVVGRWPELVRALEAAGLRVQVSDVIASIRDAPLGLSLARLAVAETGSVLLAEACPEDRAIGMLALAHAVLCPTSKLVASLDDTVEELRTLASCNGASFMTFVTGPSRTADIERVLTVGVQGPGKVMTLFIDEA